MALTYTLETIRNNLDDYADFEEVGSVARAKSYITWANRWLQRMAESQADGSSSLSQGKYLVLETQKRAQSYVSAHDTARAATTRVRFLDVRNSR